MMPLVENLDGEARHLQTDAELMKWLGARMSRQRPWLLAHADDGVIWGRYEDDQLITSHDIVPDISPELRIITLQQAFLFGGRDEVRLWREDDQWLARRINGEKDKEWLDAKECFNEAQVLWGTEARHIDRDRQFTHVREKSQQGMDHVVPLIVEDADLENRALKLCVRHYFDYDKQTGEARIALSRLVGFGPIPREVER